MPPDLAELEIELRHAIEAALEDVAAGVADELVAAIDPTDPGTLEQIRTMWNAAIPRILDRVGALFSAVWSRTGAAAGYDPGPTAINALAATERYLSSVRNRLVGIGDELWETARVTLAEGVVAGEGIPQLADRLRDAFASDGTELGESRAQLIARTETTAATNAGAVERSRTLPEGFRPGYKQWIATGDDRTRATHRAVSGTTVPLDQPFMVGGVPMDRPGDVDAPIGETANCRCTLAFGIEPDELGTGATLTAGSNITSAVWRTGPGHIPQLRSGPAMSLLEQVMSTVESNGGRWTAPEVAAAVGGDTATVRTYLARGADTGRLRRVERGIYAAAGQGEVEWWTPDGTGLWFENQETGDGRLFAEGAVSFEAGESYPLNHARRNEGAHHGAELAGAIQHVTRRDHVGGGEGVLYTDLPAGAEAVDILRREGPLGVSVDLDDVSIEVLVVDDEPEAEEILLASASVAPAGNGSWFIWSPQLGELVAAAGPLEITAAAGDPDDPDNPDRQVVYEESAGDVLMRIISARLRGATLCTIPAFDKARIELRDPDTVGVGEDELAVAARGELVASVVGDIDLTVHGERDEPWDGPGAASRVLEWAQGDDRPDGEVAERLSRAFLWRDDDADPATLAAYSLGFADIFNDELHIVPRGVFATAGGRGVDALGGVSEDDRDRIKTRICTLYGRVNDAFPDDEPLSCPFEDDGMAASLFTHAAIHDLVDDLPASAWRELQAAPAMPAEWFKEPTLEEMPAGSGGVKVVAGRAFGWVAQAGVPHEGYPGKQLTLDKLGDIDMSEFLRQEFQLDDGTAVKAGPMTMNAPHRRDGYECEDSACQFDDSRTVAAVVTVGINKRGMWFSGAAAPWLSEWDRRVFEACQPSYHMGRKANGQYKLGAILSVPRPGHPSALTAAAERLPDLDVDRVRAVIDRSNATLTAAVPVEPDPEPDITPADGAQFVEAQAFDVAALASAVVDEIERRQQAVAELAALAAEVAEIDAELAADETTDEET